MASSGQLPHIRQGKSQSAATSMLAAIERFFGQQSRNINTGEQAVSLASGSALALWGLGRRDLPGLLIAGVGAGLIYRGATAHCPVYETLDIDTATQTERRIARQGVHVVQSYSINKPRGELYAFWRDFANLPRIMSHLESVQVLDDRTSHWVTTAPRLAGGTVEWDAEITADEPNRRIAWQSLPDAEVNHRGSVEFQDAPGDRGTTVRVELDYRPPAGQLGRLASWLAGESPEQQIREDLRDFKRVMEAGEVPTVLGQPHGSCLGLGKLRSS
jgi:uncharacterized membrane protein